MHLLRTTTSALQLERRGTKVLVDGVCYTSSVSQPPQLTSCCSTGSKRPQRHCTHANKGKHINCGQLWTCQLLSPKMPLAMGRCGPRLNTWFLGTQPPQVHTKQHLDWFNHSSTDTQTCTNIQSHNTCNNRLHLLCNADWQSVVMPVSSLWQQNST